MYAAVTKQTAIIIATAITASIQFDGDSFGDEPCTSPIDGESCFSPTGTGMEEFDVGELEGTTGSVDPLGWLG
jgi:hypothetical protein